MNYDRYKALQIRAVEPGILEIVMGEEGVETPYETMHTELAQIWPDVDRDPDTRVAILRGPKRGFYYKADFAELWETPEAFALRARLWRNARDLVYGVINCSKIVVASIHGAATGGALAAGLVADVSIAARNARLMDRHARNGVAAGDGAAIVWPLLCGMAKAKLYLLTGDTISGEEAERLGLVSLVCEEAELHEKTLEIARRLAAGPQTALRWTKYSMNNWLRMAGPIFDTSLALEVLGLSGGEIKESHMAFQEKRKISFPPAPEGF